MTLFSQLTIIGTGLIGGSIGLAAKKRQLADCIVGIDTNEKNLETALDRKILDHAVTDLDQGINRMTVTGSQTAQKRKPELVIIATPVGTIPKYLEKITQITNRLEHTNRKILITDVGSTKKAISLESKKIIRNDRSQPCRYVGSHPIAGSSNHGPEHADPDLFQNRTTVITPTNSDHDYDIGLLALFWQNLGSTVLCLSPETHDRILARTSHLPHLLSSLMAENLQANEVPLTGPGFQSTTRLASGSPGIWRDVVSSNSEAILEAIIHFENELGLLKEAIQQQRWEEITTFLHLAKQNRDALDTKSKI